MAERRREGGEERGETEQQNREGGGGCNSLRLRVWAAISTYTASGVKRRRTSTQDMEMRNSRSLRAAPSRLADSLGRSRHPGGSRCPIIRGSSFPPRRMPRWSQDESNRCGRKGADTEHDKYEPVSRSGAKGRSSRTAHASLGRPGWSSEAIDGDWPIGGELSGAEGPRYAPRVDPFRPEGYSLEV